MRGRGSAGPTALDEAVTGAAVQAPSRRPDESMSLLTDLYRTALDDEYHQLAQRRQRWPDTTVADVEAPLRLGALLRKPVVALAVGLVVIAMLLTTTILQQRRGASAVAEERQSLIERITAVSERAAGLRADVAVASADLAALQESALQATEAGEAVSAELELLGMMSGATAASGPGLVVVVDDAPPGSVAEGDDAAAGVGRVQDIDLQQLVNGLWEAGAEAVAINGNRVGARSSIRAAGDAIFMDLQPLSAPYEVVAIGDPDALGPRFLDTYGAGWFQTLASAYGVQYDVRTSDSVRAPAPPAPVEELRWARTGVEQTADLP